MPTEPVFAVKTGRIYERKLIEAAIAEDGKCPVTGEDLTVEDLVPIKSKRAVRPRPVAGSSVPSLISNLSVEWDATVMEAFQLKKHVDTVRQELSHALYQHDAACRVIARLVKERDEARAALSNASSIAVAAASGAGGAPVPTDGINSTVMAELVAKSKVLAKGRKKRKAASDVPSPADVAKWAAAASTTPHLSTNGAVNCLSVHPTRGTVATGGQDKTIRLFDFESNTTLATLKGHSKAVTAVVMHPDTDVVLSGGADAQVRVWGSSGGNYTTAFALKPHAGPVTGISLSPTGNYVASVSADKTWAFSNITTGAVLTRIADAGVTAGLTCGQLHPDGLILATGTEDSLVRIWDLKQDQKNMANCAGHDGPISAVSFSDNGKHMASAGADGIVKLWDLRKLKDFQTIDMGAPVTALTFGANREYLAAGTATDVRVFGTGDWAAAATLTGHSAAVTGLGFGPSSAFLVSAGADKVVTKWA